MSYGLGVDLGTTFTAAATHRAGRTAMVTLGDRADTIPSVLLAREDGSVLVGDAAERRAPSEPERVAREVKRRLGDTVPLILGGSPHSIPSVLAGILRWVVDTASEREGGRPDRVVLTHPANWGPYKRELFASVPTLAGVGRVTTLAEPEAAAVHYAANERVDVGSLVAVYDLGGGTFDATVLRKTPRGFEFLGAPEGVEGLGGVDFDEAVYAHVDRSLDGRLAELDPEDEATASALVRLRRECVLAKEALSRDTETSIPVLLPGVPSEVRLTRAELEEMIRPALESTVAALRRALTAARVAPADLSTVLLVGGSSRIPLVSQMLSAELGRPTAVDTHPKHAVALGAAGLLDASRFVAPTPPRGTAPSGPTTALALGAARTRTAPPSRPFPAGARGPATGPTGGAGSSGGVPRSPGSPRPPGPSRPTPHAVPSSTGAAAGAGAPPPSLADRPRPSATAEGAEPSSGRRRLVPIALSAAVLVVGAVVGGAYAFGSAAPGDSVAPASVTPTDAVSAAQVATTAAEPTGSGGSGGGGGSGREPVGVPRSRVPTRSLPTTTTTRPTTPPPPPTTTAAGAAAEGS